MAEPVRDATKEEIKSLGAALKKCKWIKDNYGAFRGEAEGWSIAFGREENGQYAGIAINALLNCQINFTPEFIEKMISRLNGLN